MSLFHLSPGAGPLLPAPPAPAGRAGPARWRRWWWLALAAWLVSGVYAVSAGEQAVVTRFGRIVAPRVPPGIHYHWPWPVESAWKVKVRQLQRLMFGAAPVDEALAGQFLTGDQNIILMRVAVQYSVSDPARYLFSSVDARTAVGGAVESEMSRHVASRAVDDVLTTEKAAMQEAARESAQRLVDSYKIGVLLASVNIESVVPPGETRDAFNDVASARADAARAVSEAQGYTNDLLPRSRGEARQMIEAAEAYKLAKVNEARGDAARFTLVAGEYAKAAGVNGRRLYAETMEQILPRIKKLIVDRRGNLDLTILRRGEPPPPPVNSPKPTPPKPDNN